MQYKVLLIEDDAQICEVVQDYFTAKGGFDVITANDGKTGLEHIKKKDFDIVLLDIMLPELDGFTLCREIRCDNIVPILFITARAREEDVLYGYELGCDDYIVKPFSLAALYAKTRALLKRTNGTVIDRRLYCGQISLDLMTLQVFVSEQEIQLAPKEFAVLKYLLQHKNWVISRNTLLDRIWGCDYFGGERVVDNHIKKLRKALGKAGEQIKTVISQGYKLTE